MTAPTARRGARLDPDELAALEDQRAFLLTSLADLEREHDAGDLDDHDYEALRDEYTARAAEVLRAIDQQRLAFASAKAPRSLGRTVLTLLGVGLFAVVAGVLVAQSLGARKPGETSSGGISVKETTSQRAQACAALVSPESPSESLTCFKDVLDEDPDNVVAITWSSWQLSLAADKVSDPVESARLQATALAQLGRAVELQPGYSYARAFRAVVAYRSGAYEAAKGYLEEFRANDPDADSVEAIEQMGLEANIEAALAGADPEGTTATTAPSAPTTSTTTTIVAPG